MSASVLVSVSRVSIDSLVGCAAAHVRTEDSSKSRMAMAWRIVMGSEGKWLGDDFPTCGRFATYCKTTCAPVASIIRKLSPTLFTSGSMLRCHQAESRAREPGSIGVVLKRGLLQNPKA